MQEKQGDTGQMHKILYVMNNFLKCKIHPENYPSIATDFSWKS